MGGPFYHFENGYGDYFFYQPNLSIDYITDPEGGFRYIPISDEELPCWIIENIEVASLFNEQFETLTIEEISNIEGIRWTNTFEETFITPTGYVSYFRYSGWGNDYVRLEIYHEDENMIDLTSIAAFYIHPSAIEEILAQ